MIQCPCRGSAFFAALIASIVAFSLLSCSSKPHLNIHEKTTSELFEKTFIAKDIDTLNVGETNGNIQITLAAKDKDEISIIAEKTLAGGDSEEKLRGLLPKFHVTAALKDKSLVVESSWEGEKPKGVNSSVHYRITVPARLKVDLKTLNGDIKVEGVMGGVKVVSENGEVELKRTQGAHILSTASGAIRLTDVSSVAPLSLSTNNGEINATNIKALEVTAKTVNGGIDIETNAPTLNLTSENGEISAKLSANTSIKNMKAHATNGSIKFTLPSSVNANLRAAATNGSVKLEERGKTQEAEALLEKSLGSGGGAIDLKTENGEVAIRLQ